MVDAGKYNKDGKEYKKLVEEMYGEYAEGVTLPPEYAEFFDKNLLRLLIRLARYKFVARLVKKTDRVLEVGCGSGIGSIFLSQHCLNVTAIDVKTTEIEEARSVSKRENVEFAVADFFEMDAGDKWDVVVALDVIEHMPEEMGTRLISKMASVLKPEGMAVIGTPSLYSYEYQSPISKASHVKCYDQRELIELVEKFFGRALAFSMNDELVHTGYAKMAWYYFVLGFVPR